jgi:hypothetical protein
VGLFWAQAQPMRLGMGGALAAQAMVLANGPWLVTIVIVMAFASATLQLPCCVMLVVIVVKAEARWRGSARLLLAVGGRGEA